MEHACQISGSYLQKKGVNIWNFVRITYEICISYEEINLGTYFQYGIKQWNKTNEDLRLALSS